MWATDGSLVLVGMGYDSYNDLMIWLMFEPYPMHILQETFVLKQWFEIKFGPFI